MTEKLNHSPEQKVENLDLSAEIEKSRKRVEQAAESAGEHAPKAEEIRANAEQEAVSGKEFTVGEKEHSPANEFGSYKDMKTQTYRRSMSRVRQKLSPAEKTFSRFVHAKGIEKASESIGKTAARPSGILGGGLVALLGSSFLLYMSRQYGFRYNFFIFFLLLGAGFLLGVTIELLVYSLRKNKR